MATDSEDRSSDTPYSEDNPWRDGTSDDSGGGARDPREADRTRIIQAYRQYLRRTPSESEIQSHLGNPGGIDAALQVIQRAVGTQAESQTRTRSGSTGGGTNGNYGTRANLDRGYLEQQIRDAFAAKGEANPSQADIDYWVRKATTPDVYSDGRTRVGWNNYLRERLVSGRSSADPSLAGDEGVIENPGQWGLNTGGGGGDIDWNNPFNRQYEGTMPTAPTVGAMPTIPNAPAFQAPTWEQALQDPGYQFALQQGQKALQGSAAARGMLNTTGTLKNLTNYNQQAATQQYGNVWNRALQQYNTNYATQYQNPYEAQLNQWQMGNTANQQNYQNQWNQYMQGYNQWRNWQNDVWNRQRDYATA
jgi:hypothetical protein